MTVTTDPAAVVAAQRVPTGPAVGDARRWLDPATRALVSVGSGLAGLGLALVVWLLATAALPAKAVPSPLAVLQDLVDNHAYYPTHAQPTTITALEGFAVAAVLSLGIGALGALSALSERVVSRVGLAIYCLPLPALLPLIASLVAPGQQTRVTLAALFAFFPILVGVLAGLRSTPADMAAIVHCAGGGRLQVLARVGLRAALPQIAAGLRIAAPAALLGAIVAEFTGAEKGLGVALTVSQQKLHTTQTWGLAIVATLIGAAMYVLVTLAARLLHAVPVDAGTGGDRQRRTGIAWRLVDVAVPPLALLGLWVALVRFGGASPLIFKSPTDVLDYLVSDPAAADHRSTLVSDWWITLQHTAVVFGVGMAAAVLAACLLVICPPLLRLSGPLLIASQCVPQIAFIPLLVAVCGRGTALIVVTGLLVVFFPAMIVIVTALEERSQTSLDTITAYGGGRWATLRWARLPGAVPGILTAARLSIPLALFGALVAEWLVTGTGIANAMSTASVTFDYTRLWADVAITTVTVVTLYAVASALHDRAQRRFGA